MPKYLGHSTAYGYAKEKGYTGTEEEYAELMASYAEVAEDARQSKEAAQTAQTGAETARDEAQGFAQTATTKASEASQSASQASRSASTATTKASEAGQSADNASRDAQTASTKASEASTSAQSAEEAKDDAITAKTDAETARTGAETARTQAQTAKTQAESARDAAQQTATDMAEHLEQIDVNKTDIADLKADLSDLTTRVDSIEETEGLHRYGVSGVGQSASALTRLWDAVGMTAQVGTDGDNSNVINNFDDVTPFNRRKCVGKWHLENGKAVFHVHAYYGDEDYTEDGSMGDYVAVECPRAYYYLKDGVLGVSAHHYQGWRPFDIFCRNHDPEDTFEYYYMPAYALAEKDGHAVSLPNLDNMQGDYASLVVSARTYDGDVNTKAIIQPAAVNFYEWALYTVEFATQNCQSIMQGCSALRHSNDDHATLRSDGKWLLNNYQVARVVGEYISIQPTNIDQNNVSYYASHKITSIIRCDADGNASSSGTHQLVETEDLGTGRTYEVGGEYRFVARPYRTGTCNGVSTPSGSPVNNHNGYYPCKYRWHENPFGNQFKTVCDLFNMRVGTGDDDYSLEWFYAPDPTVISGNPSQATLETDTFELLDVTTEHENYVSGYIRSKKHSTERPDIWIPHVTTGAGASSYFCDYAYLVNSHVVRSIRFGGSWNRGARDGFSFCLACYAPSNALAFFGADLFMLQEG